MYKDADLDVVSLKRIFNVLSRKQLLDEDAEELSEEDIAKIKGYKHQQELVSLYKLTKNKHDSLKQSILESIF